MKKPVVLVIRDGWGISEGGRAAAEKEGNATLLAKTPFHDHLYSTYPMGTLRCSGEDVGLPDGQMGNSEVGHLNLGAGRIVYQDLTRINLAVKDGSLGRIPVLVELFAKLKASGGALHLIGLLSDGGVHSHEKHLHALLRLAKGAGVPRALVHALMDGRDTPPTGGAGYMRRLEAVIREIGYGEVATVVGRYFGMDRDKRWERVKQAWDAIVRGEGEAVAGAVEGIERQYAAGTTDEFLKAMVVNKDRRPLVRDGDGVLWFNFRSDRARQLSEVFLREDFSGFDRGTRPRVAYVTMTEYDKTFGCPVLFGPQSMENIFGQVVAAAGMAQLRTAETEKYPHVTYFFNGGIEAPFPGEEREMAASPKVATYDLQPEMSARELTEIVLRRLDSGRFDVVILNYANPDMVGHTGSLPAAVRAVETVDGCVKRVVEKVLGMGGKLLLTADHGNCERMIAEGGGPHTAHTTNLVHVMYAAADAGKFQVRDGILADVAPTLLEMLGLPKPVEMTGKSLLSPAP